MRTKSAAKNRINARPRPTLSPRRGRIIRRAAAITSLSCGFPGKPPPQRVGSKLLSSFTVRMVNWLGNRITHEHV